MTIYHFVLEGTGPIDAPPLESTPMVGDVLAIMRDGERIEVEVTSVSELLWRPRLPTEVTVVVKQI